MPATRLGLIDVGARGGLEQPIATYADRLDVVLVEPEPVEARRLAAEGLSGCAVTVIDRALGHIDGPIEFYETVNPTCSSARIINTDFLLNYQIAGHFRPKRTSLIQAARYDTLFQQGTLPEPHIVKVDVQGYEYEVLLGFGSLLQSTLAIQVEAHFYPMYRGQKLLGDLISFLASFDLVLRRLTNARSADLNGDPHYGGDLVEVDAVFTKSRHWAKGKPQRERNNLEFACEIIGARRYE